MKRMAAACGAILVALAVAAPAAANGTPEKRIETIRDDPSVLSRADVCPRDPAPEPTVAAAGAKLPTSAADVAITAPPVAQTGAQGLVWSKVFDVPAPFVVESIVAAHDRFYALASDSHAGYYSHSAMWTSEDGTDWVELDVAGLLSEGASLHSMVVSERGLLALGFRSAPEGYAATAWFSGDGIAWDASDLGYVVEPATQPYTTNYLSYAGAALGPGGAVVTATALSGFDWTAAQPAAAATLPTDLAGIDPGRVSITDESVQVTVGPFVVFSQPLESVGLGEVREAQRMTNSPSAAHVERPVTFRTDDLQTWTVSDGNPMPAEYVMTIVPQGGGYVAATSGRSGEAEVFVSSDGQAWEPAGKVVEGMGGLFVMGDRLLTDGWQGSRRVTLVSDDAGRTWEEAGMPDLSGSWIAAAGPAGILATGTERELGWGAEREPGVVERDGFTVTFDAAREELTVVDPSGALRVSSTLRMDDPTWGWGYTAPDELVFDFDAETAAVQNPATGETLVTLTFADLDRLGASMVTYGGEELLFSPDAEHWTVTTLAEAFDPETILGASVVGTDRVLAVAGSGYPDPFRNQAIWLGLPVSGTAAPTVETSETPPDVAMGGPALAWERVLDLGDRQIDHMLATDSGVWMIEGEPHQPSTLWHSPDGAAWTKLDTAALLGEGAIVSQMTEGGPGLVAVGTVPSGGTREAVAWISTDGQEWTLSPLGYTMPEPERPFDVPELMIGAVAAGPDGAVVAASPRLGFDWDLLEPSVVAALPVGLRDYTSSNGLMIDPWRISLSVGPFEVFSEAVPDLDVDQDLFDAYERSTSGGPEDVLLFVTDDYVTWQQVDGGAIGDEPVSAMVATGDGYRATTGGWFNTPRLYASADGLTWEETELPADPGLVRWFEAEGGRLLAVGDLGGRSAVWTSDDDGETWTAWADLPGDAWDAKAGAFGLVALGEHPSEWWDGPPSTPIVIEHDGFTLSIEEGSGGCTVTGPDGTTLLSAGLYSTGAAPGSLALPPFIVADHERAIFTVADPGGGEPLMTVTYREMQDAYDRAKGSSGLGPDTFVAYSPDGRVWSEQPISRLAGAPGWISSVAVGDAFAVMVVSEQDGPTSLWRATTR